MATTSLTLAGSLRRLKTRWFGRNGNDMWWNRLLVVVLGLMVIVAIALVYGFHRWPAATNELHAKLEAAHLPISPTTYDSRALHGVPAPVPRYFRTVREDGQPLVSVVSLEHTGTFNLSATGAHWRPFTSTQRVTTNRPGFVWDGRIALMPGMAVRVHDAYVAGEGLLHATLFGLVSLVNLRSTPEVAQGELMRCVAEAAWYPTALLPRQGMHWEAVDEASARATLKDGDTTVTLLVRFNQHGLIASVRAEAHGRTVAGAVMPTPWEGRWSTYELRDGMRIPLQGEVAWMLPEGPKPYWRGRMTRLRYACAP
jgi:hypothetical protein